VTPLRVLMVEDTETDAKLIALELQRTWPDVELERVDTAEAMGAALEGKVWDVVLSDWSMPTFTAPAALAVIKAKQLDLPFIIVSGTIGEETAVEAMRAGAHDFVLKDKLTLLRPAIERARREGMERAARRLAEEALRQSETRFRRLADSGIIGIVVAELEGKILDANDAFLRMLGYSRAELLDGSLRWPDLTPPALAPLAARALAQLESCGVAPPWESESLGKEGRCVPVLLGAAMLEAPQFIVVLSDLTERKQAEAGRARAESALRQSEEQLQQAQKMEAIGRLAGGVAHDFNNILSVILSYGALILEGLRGSDPLRADIEEITKAAGRAAGLTRQLLMFSRQQVVAPQVLDLHEVLKAMTPMIQRILGADVELVVVAPKAAGRVKVDPTHIEQVVLNLIVNARDAMPTGGKLTIETSNVELDEGYALTHLPSKVGPHVMMTVSDTGGGMSPETQARIFEPFFTTKEVGKGTGLGLSTVFGIVHQSGGNVWVYSELGIGTTFKVYLPRVDADVDVIRGSGSPKTLHGTETILLVEDESQVRTIVANILQRQGYRVLSAPNAAEALALSEAHEGTIDLLVSDVVMPRMSGPELAKRIAPMRPAMKVLCMSGYTDDSIVRHGVLDAGVAFLQKPITPSALASKVRAVLDDT
jgi:PAS domain S-box-containing protein